MTVQSTFFLSFVSDTGKSIRLTIPRADREMTEVEVEDGMNDLIDCGIILTSNGRPVAIKNAERLTRTIEPLVAA